MFGMEWVGASFAVVEITRGSIELWELLGVLEGVVHWLTHSHHR